MQKQVASVVAGNAEEPKRKMNKKKVQKAIEWQEKLEEKQIRRGL